MYNALLLLHSWNRWLVLLFGVLAVGAAAIRLSRRAEWDRGVERSSLLFTITTDIQFLLGLILYFVSTSWFQALLQSPASVMGDRVARFWAVEHAFGMLVALALLHIGRVKVKKAAADRKAKLALIFFGVALFFMLATIPWPFMPYPRPLFRI